MQLKFFLSALLAIPNFVAHAALIQNRATTSSTASTVSTPTRTVPISTTATRPVSSTSSKNSSTNHQSSTKASSTTRVSSSGSVTASVQTPTRPASTSIRASTTSTTPTSSTPSSRASTDPSQTFIQATLDSHNTARAEYGASPLVWNSSLYPATQQWANACVFQHSGGNYGENLAAEAPQGITVQEGVNLWMDEASQYNYSNPTFSSSTGHFTQVVWKSTTSVACAIGNCSFLGSGTGYLVCRYFPPGNYLGQFAQNVGRPVN
ncbi:CAP domain-containing protein [Lentinula raphanica]|uniref:CAP domain-containing protein n=1 Tax=Lentinula raphanica TaxID=153919 RepID=A0AA38P4A5_9AGAR|nr:CAP domain-containing protein [Lentinula raphanica]KAJ3835946.1 CAP domain-containing protein [Lentinula raphanica]KAJ3971085.1 CAP domain-containing protein [Lentinula raphanica]